LVEQLDYNFLFRWFVGLAIDDPVWDHSSFSKNHDRLIASDIAVSVMLCYAGKRTGANNTRIQISFLGNARVLEGGNGKILGKL
jgi:transposase